MKRSVFILVISLCLIIYSVISNATIVENQGENRDTCFYLLKVPADIDVPKTPHFDTTIVRSINCKTHILLLQSWGTQTSYNLMSEKYARSTSFVSRQKGMMDISDLPEGEYGMSLMSCGNGGGFTLRLK